MHNTSIVFYVARDAMNSEGIYIAKGKLKFIETKDIQGHISNCSNILYPKMFPKRDHCRMSCDCIVSDSSHTVVG